VEEVVIHLISGYLAKHAEHASEQDAVLATAELTGDDDAAVGTAGDQKLLVERGEVADVVVRMARESPVAKTSCSSSLAVSLPACWVVRQSQP
jgi:hypothetical protein